MTQSIALSSIFFAATGAFAPLMPAFIPGIGLLPLYRMRLIRAILLTTAWSLAIAACVLQPASYLALPFVFIFSIPAIFMEPDRIFIPLVDPKHVPVSEANMRVEDIVFGFEDGEHAIAWPFKTLVPRHLINDRLEEEPLLVAY